MVRTGKLKKKKIYSKRILIFHLKSQRYRSSKWNVKRNATLFMCNPFPPLPSRISLKYSYLSLEENNIYFRIFRTCVAAHYKAKYLKKTSETLISSFGVRRNIRSFNSLSLFSNFIQTFSFNGLNINSKLLCMHIPCEG